MCLKMNACDKSIVMYQHTYKLKEEIYLSKGTMIMKKNGYIYLSEVVVKLE